MTTAPATVTVTHFTDNHGHRYQCEPPFVFERHEHDYYWCHDVWEYACADPDESIQSECERSVAAVWRIYGCKVDSELSTDAKTFAAMLRARCKKVAE